VPEGGGKKLVYYYDIADTRETDKSKPFLSGTSGQNIKRG